MREIWLKKQQKQQQQKTSTYNLKRQIIFFFFFFLNLVKGKIRFLECEMLLHLSQLIKYRK